MRSRDGTQTVCVVCEPSKPSVPAPQPSLITSTTDKSKFYSIVAVNVLKTLDKSLSVDPAVLSTDIFVSLFESALSVLVKCSPVPEELESVHAKLMAKINNLIEFAPDSSEYQAVISHFQVIEKLLNLSRKLEEL